MANCIQTRLSLPSSSNIVEKATTGAIYIFPIPGAFDRGFEVKFFPVVLLSQVNPRRGGCIPSEFSTIKIFSSRIMTMIPI